MKKLLIALVLLASSPAYAILSPLNQSIAELRNIVMNDQLSKKLPSSEQILGVKAVENGYLIHTQDYSMFVEIVYKPQQMVGPVRFDLIFHEPVRNYTISEK
ncbi:MAG: hypothetical protein JJU12_00970 [Chlamydiales bacterium]|nr:hypothetical protein [Chlamydiales bacterium]